MTARLFCLILMLILNFLNSMKEKLWLKVVLNLVKYAATLLLGYLGGSAVMS